jgi:acyl carrier protein
LSVEQAGSIEQRVSKVFIDTINLDAAQGADRLLYNEVEGWDSVGHMMLVAGLEQEFDCMLDMDDILEMSSFAKAVEIMGRYVHA